MDSDRPKARVLGAEVSEEDLAHFYWAKKVYSGLHLRDEGGRLVASYRAVPMWFVAGWMLVVGAVGMYFSIREMRQGEGMALFGVVLTPLAVITVIAILWAISRQLRSYGKLIIVEKQGRRLELPGFGVVLSGDEVVEVVRIRGRIDVHGEMREVFEVALLARTGEGHMFYSVAAGEKPDVDRLAEAIAEAMGRPIHDVSCGEIAA